MSTSPAAVPSSDPVALAPDPDWWRGAVIYQIYPRSFQDTNGDGIGDLPGITRRLPYIASLGADAIWISPFFTSPMDDFGYDVADYRAVDPMFGTLADFDALVAEARRVGLRVMIDLVISHTSDRHAWFQESRSSCSNPRADWYVWAEAKPDGTPPNNWLSVFGGPAWEWDTRRGQYYLHNFLATQPDLNFHEPDVQDAVLDVARFWLDRGVSGFRLDTVNFYFHDRELRDNPPKPSGERSVSVSEVNPYARQVHLYDKDRPENLAFLERLRALMDRYPDVTAVGELGTDNRIQEITAAYTAAGRRLHMAYSFDLLQHGLDAPHVRRCVEAMEAGIGTGWPSWALSNHDVVRVATRWGMGDAVDQVAPLALAMLACLRGTPCIYQGEELGLDEFDVPFEQLQDPYGKRFWPEFKGRDGCRTPMPWAAGEAHSGFSDRVGWLPVAEPHRSRAVDRQEQDPASALLRVRAFLHWRRTHPALAKGDIAMLPSPAEALLFTRRHEGETLLCAFNLSPEPLAMALPAGMAATALQGHGFGGLIAREVITLPAFDAAFARVS
jgi:alpha-glucosidase